MAIDTHRDVLRHTAGRTAVAVSLAVVLTWAMTYFYFGTDPDLKVTVGFVERAAIFIAIVISAILTCGLSYRSAMVMKQLSQARVELARVAATDNLTGLFNRRGFDEAAGHAQDEARTTGANIAVLMCDIDRFKTINDRFGHEVGDDVLQALGQVLGDFGKQHRLIVARHGGEEFAVFMTGVTRQQAAKYAEDLRQRCSAKEVTAGDSNVRITVSVGYAMASASTTHSALMRAADVALYAAKHRGRNQVAEAYDGRATHFAAAS